MRVVLVVRLSDGDGNSDNSGGGVDDEERQAKQKREGGLKIPQEELDAGGTDIAWAANWRGVQTTSFKDKKEPRTLRSCLEAVGAVEWLCGKTRREMRE